MKLKVNMMQEECYWKKMLSNTGIWLKILYVMIINE